MPNKDKIHSFLKKWIINFIKNKDLILKNIETIEEKKDGFDGYVKYKDKEQYISVIPYLKDFEFLDDLEKEKHYVLI